MKYHVEQYGNVNELIQGLDKMEDNVYQFMAMTQGEFGYTVVYVMRD